MQTRTSRRTLLAAAASIALSWTATSAGFAQADLGAVSLHGEITLFDRSAVKMAQIRRKPLQQKFAFNLTGRLAVFNCSDHRGLCESLYRASPWQARFVT